MEKKEKKKVLINKVTKRLLEIYPPSVKNGLEDESQILDYDDKIKIGQGSFGQVFHAKHKKTGAIYAIKAIDKKNKTNQDGKSYFRREIEIMYKIRHPNIVKLYTHFEDNDFCYFVMEYISKGNLFENLQKQRTKCFDTKTVVHYMRDLLSAVYYLHKMDPPIVHRDIKLENILLHENGTLKLTDFGWSNYIFDDEVRDTFCGTPVYQAPEMVNRKEHDHNVDIWCLGIIMFEILTGYLPFNAMNKEILEDSIKKVKINWPNDIDRAAKDLIKRILRYEPKDRISIENMFKHPFFTSVFPNPIDYLIKPNRNEEFEIFIISSQIPSKDENNVDSLLSRQNIASSVVKPEVANNENSTNPNQEVKFLKSKLNDYLNKINSLQEQLSQEQTNNNFLKNKVDMIEKEKTYLMNQFANVKKDKDIVQENEQPNENPNIDKEESKEQVENLQKVNNKLLEEIESLNEKLEFHKDFYINHLKDLESQLKNNLKINENSIDNSISNYRESLSNMKPSNELNEAKEKFEAEILKLKELMNTEREKYNFVIQNNIEELNKLQNEKNMIKESSARYYEKVILKYDERLKLKNAEIEDLKAKLKKND